MRISISRGTIFSCTFLSLIAISHCFVFWIPVWKSHSLLRYHPKRGWTPIRSRGSGLFRPNNNYNFYSPSNHHPKHRRPAHHFYSTYHQKYRSPHHDHHEHKDFFPSIHHHKFKTWKLPRVHLKKSPLYNLNGHHPLCPLCHLAEYWNKPRKPLHHGGHHGFFSSGGHHKNHHFSPSSVFPRVNRFRPFHKPGSFDSPHHNFADFSGPINSFPKAFSDFPKFSKNGNKFNYDDSQFYNDQPVRQPYRQSYRQSHRQPYRQQQSSHQNYKSHNNNHNKPHHYPKKTSYRQPKKPVNYEESPNPSFEDDFYDLDKIRDSKPQISPLPEIESLPPVISASPAVSTVQSQQQDVPKESSDFWFNGFGAGQKGSGWEGWDW